MKSVVENIVELSDDPIQSATFIQKYINNLPAEDKSIAAQYCFAALAGRFYHQIDSQWFYVESDGGRAVPDKDKKQPEIPEQRFEGKVRVIGHLATFAYLTHKEETSIALRLCHPRLYDTYLLDSQNGNLASEITDNKHMPAFKMAEFFAVPILDVKRYHALTSDEALNPPANLGYYNKT